MKFRASSAAVLVTGSLLLAACAPNPQAPAVPAAPVAPAASAGTEAPKAAAPAADANKKISVALIVGVKGDPFYVTMEKGARAAAEKLNIDLTVDGPAQFNPTLQTPIVDAMIAKKIDVLVIAATDKQAMIEPLKRANDAGIKVISVDTYIGDSDGDYSKGSATFPLSYVGSDNRQGGKIACEAVIKAMGGKGKLYIQNVKPGISTTDQREQGCKDAIDASKGAVTLVGTDYNDDSAAKSAEQTTAVLQREKDLGGIFGTNLFGAEGAAQAVKNAGLAGAVKIASFDAPEQAIKDLKDGVVDLVIAQLPGQMGSTAMQYAADAVAGKMDGIKKRFPTSYVVIDKANVDTPEAQAAIYKGQ